MGHFQKGERMSMRKPLTTLTVGTLSVVAAMGGLLNASPTYASVYQAPQAMHTPIKHVVEIMLENHTFDNLFGHYPNANGIPQGLKLPNPNGNYEAPEVTPIQAGTNVGDTVDIDHNRAPEVMMMHNGEMNYYTVFPLNGLASITTFGRSDVPNEWALAQHFSLAERNFQPATGPTQPNREYAIAGTTEGWISDTPPNFTFTFPTIFNDLQSHGHSWGIFQGDYYSQTDLGNGFVKHWNSMWYSPLRKNKKEWNAHVFNTNAFVEDAKTGNLPNFSFVVPSWMYSEHPPTDLSLGDAWVGQLVTALMKSPDWSSTAIFITYDEGGGYWDHVTPPQPYRFGYGTRTPMVIISPWVRQGLFNQTTTNVSILSFMEHLWGLPPLTKRDAQGNDLLADFNFHQKPLAPIVLPNVPTDTLQIADYPAENLSATQGKAITLTILAKTAGLLDDRSLSGKVTLRMVAPKEVNQTAISWPRSVTLVNGEATGQFTFPTTGYYRIFATGPNHSFGVTTIDVGMTPNGPKKS